MDAEVKPPLSEREHTDESLRAERERADKAFDEELAASDETADAVISRARARADAVLATARAKADRREWISGSSAQSPAAIKRERVLEDKVLQEQRSSADETLREERAEHAGLLASEREETDKDLSSERARSDESLATRDEFLGLVSHDLRNMLNAIVSFASLIGESAVRKPDGEQARRYAQRIERSGARMNRLIGDLVDVASIDAGVLAVTREVGDPTDVVKEAVDTFQAQALARGVSLRADIATTSLLMAFDPARILQVLGNLISNALKFTPAHGAVVVHVARIGDEVQFAVSDTGEGVPPDKLEAVFDRFLQVKNDRRGVGLGLYISRAIVHGHAGRIWAASTLGQGSTFTFALPVRADG